MPAVWCDEHPTLDCSTSLHLTHIVCAVRTGFCDDLARVPALRHWHTYGCLLSVQMDLEPASGVIIAHFERGVASGLFHLW